MVRGGDRNCIHFFVLDEFPNVLVFPNAFKVSGTSIENIEIDVAQRREADTFDPAELVDVRAAAAVKTHNRDADFVIGPDDLRP